MYSIFNKRFLIFICVLSACLACSEPDDDTLELLTAHPWQRTGSGPMSIIQFNKDFTFNETAVMTSYNPLIGLYSAISVNRIALLGRFSLDGRMLTLYDYSVQVLDDAEEVDVDVQPGDIQYNPNASDNCYQYVLHRWNPEYAYNGTNCDGDVNVINNPELMPDYWKIIELNEDILTLQAEDKEIHFKALPLNL
jgi:hypothetical protein